MAERRRPHYNPYQMPFDYDAKPLQNALHVRAVYEAYQVHTPADAASYLMQSIYAPFEQFKQEHIYVLLLDNRNKITHEVMVYKGTVNAINIRSAELFMEAVKVNAPSIVLSHCHPSGDPTPSPEDIRTTELVYQAGQLLSIELMDHIIVGRDRWVSLKERKLGFPS